MLAMLAATVLAVIGPNDARIAYIGRFDSRFACQWPASEVRLLVQGKTLQVTLNEDGQDFWQVVVDGTPREVLALKPGSNTYSIDLKTSARHEVRLVKRAEPFVGTTRVESFMVPGGTLIAAKPSGRRLEFVGDSITCGYGNEGASRDERFLPETENAYQSYASIAARALKADATLIAWSGRKMWPDNTVPSIYDEVLPTKPGTKYDFRRPAPHAVVIHLATNDFGPGNPKEEDWTGAYEAFIRRLWGHYPKARIYVAMGSMMNDSWPPNARALSTLRGYMERMVRRMNDPRVRMVEFDVQREEDGIGSDWHPSVRTHQKMADRLAEVIRKDLEW